jgi:transposase
MLKMDQVHVIRHKILVEKKSRRSVARQLGLSRNTVARYLTESEPVRREKEPRRCPVREAVRQRINELLEEWSQRTTRKQRITGTRLHRQLIEEGFVAGKTSVYEVLRERRRQRAEVYIPLLYEAGDVAQVDFFEVTVDVAGVREQAWKFVMRLMYSGYDFVWLYERCDQLSFLDAHVRAFAHFNGVPARLVYDNLAAAVQRKVHAFGVERKLTTRFSALSSHYLFEPCFARPGEGHDKGGVEARGKGIRLQHLTPIPVGDTLQKIAEGVLQEVVRHAELKHTPTGESVATRFAVEQRRLRLLPAVPFSARAVRLLCASRSATVQIEGALYSVPSRWARLDVTAYIGVEEIELVCRGEREVHKRVSAGARSVRYRHYLPELSRKPQAVRQVAVELVAELGEPYPQLWQLLVATHGGLEAGRTLARLLAAVGSHGEEVVRGCLERAVAQAAPGGVLVSADEPLRLEVEVPDALRFYTVEAGRAADYDWMLAGGGER